MNAVPKSPTRDDEHGVRERLRPSAGASIYSMADDFAAFLGEGGSVTHALLAHEQATEAADAASLEEAREKHLGASKNFLASAEDCGDESTKKALLLLSRGHARAAMQISERIKRSVMDPAADGGSLTSLGEDSPAVSQSISVKAQASLLQQPRRMPSSVSRANESPARAGPSSSASAGGAATKEFLALEKVLARFGARPLRRKDHNASSMAESLSASVSMMGSSALYKSCVLDTGRGGLLGESFVLPPPSSEAGNSANGTSRRLAGGLPTPRSLRESLTLSSINEAHERRQDQLFRVRTDEVGDTGSTGSSQSTERQQLGQSVITSAVTAGHSQDAAVAQHPQAQQQRQRHKQGSSGDGRFIPSQEYALQQAELIRCLKTTQLLHDENAKLLDVNQELREKLKAAQDIDIFKMEYSRIFKKVKEELLKFREAYPHLKNPAATVPNAAEKQLRQLHLAYEKKAKKLKESEGSNLKLQRRVHQYDKKLKQYEAAFRKLSERVALKRANAQSGDKGGEVDARRKSIENREQLVRASNSTQRWEREQLKQQRVQARDQQVQQLRRQTSPAGAPNVPK